MYEFQTEPADTMTLVLLLENSKNPVTAYLNLQCLCKLCFSSYRCYLRVLKGNQEKEGGPTL